MYSVVGNYVKKDFGTIEPEVFSVIKPLRPIIQLMERQVFSEGPFCILKDFLKE